MSFGIVAGNVFQVCPPSFMACRKAKVHIQMLRCSCLGSPHYAVRIVRRAFRRPHRGPNILADQVRFGRPGSSLALEVAPFGTASRSAATRQRVAARVPC